MELLQPGCEREHKGQHGIVNQHVGVDMVPTFSKQPEAATVDDLLVEEVGQFGRGQVLILCVCGLAFATAGVIMFLMTFTSPGDPSIRPGAWHCTAAATEDARCHVVWALVNGASLDGSSGDNNSATAPAAAAATTAAAAFCDLTPAQYAWAQPASTLETQFNLVCGNSWKVEVLDTSFFVGFMAGNGILGAAADAAWGGRRRTMRWAAAATVVLTLVSAAAGPLWLVAVARVLSGTSTAGCTLASYVLISEMVGPAWRGTAGMMVQTFYIFGEFALVAGAVLLQRAGWRAITAASALPMLCVLLLACWVPESPRWLLTAEQQRAAGASLKWIAKRNGTQLLRQPALAPSSSSSSSRQQQQQQRHHGKCGSHGGAGAADVNTLAVELVLPSEASGRYGADVDSDHADQDYDTKGETAALLQKHVHTAAGKSAGRTVPHRDGGEAKVLSQQQDLAAGNEACEESLLQMLRHALLRRYFLATIFTMCALSLAYFGVTLALGSLGGSLAANFFLTACAELPAYLTLVCCVERVGRRAVVMAGALIAGLACTAVAFADGGAWQVILAMAGKFGCSSAWALGITYAGELFPTSCRSAAVGAISQAGDLGGILAPLLLLAGRAINWTALPFMIMGVVSLVGAALVALLPETRGMPQTDSIQELLDHLHARGHHYHGQ